MENFVKKKYILIHNELNYENSFRNMYFGFINKYDLLLADYGFISLNKNHISEILEAAFLPLNLKSDKLYEYISFYSGRKVLMVEKKNDFNKKINDFSNLKYQQIIMSNGNKYFVISD